MNKWEYGIVRFWRKVKDDALWEGVVINFPGTANSRRFYESREFKEDESISTIINQYGLQGWELISVVPRSDAWLGASSGFSTSMMYHFKREVKD